jgi:hypothetical protein
MLASQAQSKPVGECQHSRLLKEIVERTDLREAG